MGPLILLLTPLATADDGADIAARIAAAGAGYGDMTASIEMVLRAADGKESTRAMHLAMLERPGDHGDQSLLVFDSPNDVRGTALLSHAGVGGADQQWLFLPALGQTRRLAGAGRAGSFVGSEFAYEDVTGVELSKHTWTLQGAEPCGTGTCDVLRIDSDDKVSGYGRRLVWVPQGSAQPERIEFFDRDGELLKTLTYADYELFEGRWWRARTWTMVDHQSGRSTVLRFDDLQFATGLTEADFAPTSLKRM